MHTIARLQPFLVAVSRTVFERLRRALEAVAFWVAVALPMSYIPLLVLAGNGYVSTRVLVGVLSVNLLALVVGHRYNRPTSTSVAVTPVGDSMHSHRGGE